MTNQVSPSFEDDLTNIIQHSLEEAGANILKLPESPSDFVVSGSAFIATVIVLHYLYRFIRKVIRPVSKK
jgi:hypothetical protein